MTTPTSLQLERTVGPGDPQLAVDLLAAASGLPKARLKDAMIKGAVWLRRAGPGQTRRRLRRAKTELKPGDSVWLYYDERVLAQPAPPAVRVDDRRDYSVWYKPPGLLAQGTDYGDHASILRQVEQAWPHRELFLVHRLDREAGGLMVIAHNRRTAAALSALFQGKDVDKQYRVLVRGDIRPRLGERAELDGPLDGKPALTRLTWLAYDAGTDASLLSVTILTGRLHQIRRHLADAGHPVLGDPQYGRHNKDPGGLRLLATRLAFRCPLSGRPVSFELAEALRPF